MCRDRLAQKTGAKELEYTIGLHQRTPEAMGGGGRPFAALAKQQGVSRSYFTRLVRLSYLAPDITQAILDRR